VGFTASPEKLAMMTCEPRLSDAVEQVATKVPEFATSSAAAQPEIANVPSRNCTVPEGALPATVAVSVTL